MSPVPCIDCHIPMKPWEAVIRSESFVRKTACKPCAEDRGWIDPARPVLSLVAS